MALPKKILLGLLPFFTQVNAQVSGSGTTTRYWDCCKASCGWLGKATLASGSNPVTSCDASDNSITNYNAVSGCDGGSTYMCSTQQPWAISETLSYGFAATSISGGTVATWCCACYALTFTSTSIAGKTLIVQSTNTGGFGIYDGCDAEWGTPSTGWGAQYGGISDRSDCDAFPAHLQSGCYWRFDWFEDADNPSVTFEQVACPAALTAKSGCVRADDSINETPTGASVVATWTSGAAASSTSTSNSSVGAASSSSTSKATTTTTSSSTTTSSASGSSSTGTVAMWGQCGGNGWTGGKVCAAGSTCTVSNEWYSQCL